MIVVMAAGLRFVPGASPHRCQARVKTSRRALSFEEGRSLPPGNRIFPSNFASMPGKRAGIAKRRRTMSIGLILIIILVIFLVGGFSGRFGGYGYGYGHRGVGIIGIVLIVLVVLLLMGRI
jgi:hypothetical protein